MATESSEIASACIGLAIVVGVFTGIGAAGYALGWVIYELMTP